MLKYFLGLMVPALFSTSIWAQQEIALEKEMRPVWEVGAFGAAFNTPKYPGAGSNKNNVIVAPLLIYRGEVFRFGEGAIARAVAVDKPDYELDISLAASFGADADDNEARAGMPELDFIFEIGPQLKWRLSEFSFAQNGRSELYLNLQTRAAFSTDFSGIEKRGYVLQPQLAYRQKGWLSEKTALAITLSPSWASEELHDYFYQVDGDYVTDSRAAYDADGGYMGTRLSTSVSFNVSENIRLFLGGSVNFLGGAANTNSPLFEETSTYSVGAGLVWRLWQSEQRVSGR